jgi:hypothetical protein
MTTHKTWLIIGVALAVTIVFAVIFLGSQQPLAGQAYSPSAIDKNSDGFLDDCSDTGDVDKNECLAATYKGEFKKVINSANVDTKTGKVKLIADLSKLTYRMFT